jgi:hypothetical protein
MKRLLIRTGLALALILILAIPVALVWIPHAFLSSETFRQEMNRQTSQTLNIRGEWMPFRLDGWTLSSAGFEGTGSLEGNQLHVRAEQLTFKINWRALLTRTWSIDPITVQKVDLRITAEADEAPVEVPAEFVAPTPTPGFLKVAALFIPQKVDIHQIILEQASLAWAATKDEIYRIDGLQAKSIADGFGLWSTSVSKGTFSPPDRLPWNLNSARLLGDLNRMDLEHAEWFGQDSGIIKMSGPLFSAGKLHVMLKLSATALPATSLVPEQWTSFVEGTVDGKGSADLIDGKMKLAGKLEGQGIKLIGVPVLRSMQMATGIREWTELPLTTAWAEFTYTEDHLSVPKSVFDSAGLARLEGNFKIENQQLQGVYQVGMSDRVVSRIPGAAQTVFTTSQNGYYWAQPPMTLSGTSKDPKEDLSPRLKTAIFDAVQQKINQGVDQGLNIFKSILERVP